MNEFWSLNEGTFYCLYDDVRTEAFRKAIVNTIKKGDVVVELGAGSGVLSMFAADSGASKVYAVELDSMNVKTLRESIIQNGYGDKIEVIEGDATSITIPVKADVIICEMIATALIEELQIPVMNNAHKFMKEDCRVLLKQYDITADLVTEKNEFYGKKFHVVRYEFPDLEDLYSTKLSNTHVVRSIDFSVENKETFIDTEFILDIQESGVINGLRLGGVTTFCDESKFDYSISYSFPAIFPLQDIVVSVGDKVSIKLEYDMCEGPRKLEYKVTKL